MIAAALLLASSTLCHFTPVTVTSGVTDRVLDGCGGANTDNLLWNLDRADSLSALDGHASAHATGKGAVVYVCDVGVMAAHDEFARDNGSAVIAGIETGKASCAGGNDVLEPCWTGDGNLLLFSHGTAVASVVAGKNVGIAPDAKIVAVRIIGDETVWVKGMEAIIKHAFAAGTPPFQTAIINISGGVAFSAVPKFEAVMRKMIEGVDADGNPDPNGKRFLFVAAAGNTGQCVSEADRTVAVYPGVLGPMIDGLVTVGGLDRTNSLWSGSCFGSAVEVLAPAEDVFVASVSAKDRYRYQPEFFNSGTSYATPYVSGMAARMLEVDPTLTPRQLEERLKASPSVVIGLPVPVDPAPVPDRRRAVR